METQSIPWREKVQLIVRFLRGSIHYFVVALLCACLGWYSMPSRRRSSA